MDTSLGEDGHAIPIISKVDNCSGDENHAVVLLVAPKEWHDERLKKLLVDSLSNEGIECRPIEKSKMSEAQKFIEKEIEEIKTKFENLIVVIIAHGFYHDDGEAIIFDDCFVLLDTFIDPLLPVAQSDRKCKKILFSTK